MATYAEPIAERRVTTRRTDSTVTDRRILLAPAGRALLSAIFIASGFMHFSATIGYAASQGLTLASILVPLSGLIAIAGGVSVLLGFHARIGAWLLVLFLVPVTFTMHQFWTLSDPAAQIVLRAFALSRFRDSSIEIEGWAELFGEKLDHPGFQGILRTNHQRSLFPDQLFQYLRPMAQVID